MAATCEFITGFQDGPDTVLRRAGTRDQLKVGLACTWEVDLYELEASLVYGESSRTARAQSRGKQKRLSNLVRPCLKKSEGVWGCSSVVSMHKTRSPEIRKYLLIRTNAWRTSTTQPGRKVDFSV